MKLNRSLIVASLLAVMASFGVSLAAAADDQEPVAEVHSISDENTKLQKEIDEVLAKVPGSVQTGSNEVTSADGKVVLTIPESENKTLFSATGMEFRAAAQTCPANCPYKWTCIYEHANFCGRRLQFSDCAYAYLKDWGFTDRTSSWHNNQTKGTKSWVYNLSGGRYVLLWEEGGAPSKSTSVGSGNNDKADAIRACL